jgi:N-acetylglutamate synthase-like GNAT family acetyltransferase
MKLKITNTHKIFITLLLLAVAVCGFMIRLPEMFRHHDRQLHAAFYFVAAAFFTLLLAKRNIWAHLLIVASLAIFGIVIEHAQEYSNSFLHKQIHGRYDPEDVKYNLMGLAAFSAVWLPYLLAAFVLKPGNKSRGSSFHKEPFSISTDKQQLDVEFIHRYLSTEAYWSKGIPMHTLQKALENSMCFGLYEGKKQLGFARVITDMATIAYLGDVFITPEFQGRGLGKWLLQEIMNHPELQGMRRWILLTSDAHELYRQQGFTDLADPTKWMEISNKNVYAGSNG